MHDIFDELAKSLAQCVTRRGAIKKFGLSFAGILLASLGLAKEAQADPIPPAPCLGLGASCCMGLKNGEIKKCQRQCQQRCCSGTFTAPSPGVFMCL